jgi:putative protease
MSKPELLIPAGSVESFYAALEGGADAIYLGLKDFNARKRAKNFTLAQLPTLITLAHKQNTKLYITLNTVVKNEELPLLYSMLGQLAQTKVDAVIIQDWGVFYILKKYFPKLIVHASTQMAFHNSVGANFGSKVGIERIILARELTFKELKGIQQKSKVELELFVHGALCYSFSGMCLFSSYLGGMSANRGACKQPCRRLFTDNNDKHYLFSLKDNELLDFIPKLSKLGISSLKVEGRMKSDDYVYTIARAYRMVIDDHSKLEEAHELLKHDIGRDKTTYFMGGNVSNAITDLPNTGLYTGKVISASNEQFVFQSELNPEEIKRVRIVSPDGSKQETLSLQAPSINENMVTVNTNQVKVNTGDLIYTIGFTNKSFPSKLPNIKSKPIITPSLREGRIKTSNLCNPAKKHRAILYLRIDSFDWLAKINLKDIDQLILNIPFKDWDNFSIDSPFIAMNKAKFIVELPKFISEDNCDKYKRFCHTLSQKGISKFMVNHISQIDLLPKDAKKIASSLLYTFNDAAVAQLQRFGFISHIYPQETDIYNLTNGQDRNGIIALHFTPELFYSRMPVKTFNKEGNFSDDTKTEYTIIKREGMTLTIPQKPVSILQNKNELLQKGFNQFLIDVSFSSPSKNTFETLIEKYYDTTQYQPSTSFNYKKGLT